ncbi:hypothetical protein A2U01_0066364, partial [Trifolium medium]|nr:hypothetical protein [Trifolium medium]
PEEFCSVRQRRPTAYTDAEYDQMLHELAIPGKDWRYDSRGGRSRLQGTEMMPIAKAWAKWLVHIFECCSNETKFIMSRCHAVYA